MPLVPSALALWAINFIDRWFVAFYKGQSEVGVYSVAVRIASAVIFLLLAFRTAWPAFAYSITDDRDAKRAYAFVLTYVLLVTCWLAAALGAARALARAPAGSQPRLPARLRGGRAARLLRGRLRRLHRARDRLGARAPDAAELGDLRARRRGEHRPQRAPDPALRNDRRGDLDARRLCRALPRDALVRAARVPGRLPVATRGDGRGRRGRARRDRARRGRARSRSRSCWPRPTRSSCSRSASSYPPSGSACGGSCPCFVRRRARWPSRRPAGRARSPSRCARG